MEHSMYDCDGNRKYMNWRERRRFMRAARPKRPWLDIGSFLDHLRSNRQGKAGDWSVFTFCLALTYTGGRISEVLALTPRHIDVQGHIIVFRTLKKRGRVAYRPVPVPARVIRELDAVHQIKAARRDAERVDERIWPWCRTTAWTRVKEVMDAAGITGIHATAKGLRHGYAIQALVSGLSDSTVMRLLGHSRIETTLVYTEVAGAEARTITSRMWGLLLRVGLRH